MLIKKKQINTLGFLQPELDLFSLQFVTQTTFEDKALAYLATRAFDTRQRNLLGTSASLKFLDTSLEGVVRAADYLLHGDAAKTAVKETQHGGP